LSFYTQNGGTISFPLDSGSHLNVLFTIILLTVGWNSDLLRAGLAGDRIPMGDEIFRTRPDRSQVLPNLLILSLFSGRAGFRKFRVTPSLSVENFMVCCRLN
jgi:hypothetical protein